MFKNAEDGKTFNAQYTHKKYANTSEMLTGRSRNVCLLLASMTPKIPLDAESKKRERTKAKRSPRLTAVMSQAIIEVRVSTAKS